MVGNCISLYRSDFLTELMRFISLPGDGTWIPVFLTIVMTAIFLWKKERVFAFILLIAPLAGQIIKYLLKNFYQIPRPEVFDCPVLVNYADRYSFPSGHVTFYTIFFGLLVYWAIKNFSNVWSKLLFTISAIMILLVGYSRIYLGAHWYLDIIGGYILGGAILTVAILIYEYLKKAQDV